MGGISSTGLISGIDSASLIEQLLALKRRPIVLAQQRQFQLTQQQAGLTAISGRLSTLQSAANGFRIDRVFDSRRATSSDEDVLTASASPDAQPGTYGVLVDRLVSTQQRLSRGFVDRDTSPFGIPSLTFESEKARVDRAPCSGKESEHGQLAATQLSTVVND